MIEKTTQKKGKKSGNTATKATPDENLTIESNEYQKAKHQASKAEQAPKQEKPAGKGKGKK